MNKIPSAVNAAKKLILEHPECFIDSTATQLLLAKVMHDYHNKAMEWIQEPEKYSTGSLLENLSDIKPLTPINHEKI